MPPDIVTSVASNPVTSSEKMNVTVNGAVVLIFSGTPIATVGAAVSQVAVSFTADSGPLLPPSSVAASFATVTVTPSPSLGVTTSV